MTVGEGLTGSAIVVSTLVWVLTQWVNRKHEIFKERVKCRLGMYQIVFPTLAKLNLTVSDKDTVRSVDLTDQLTQARVQIHCFGTTEEMELFESLVKGLNEKILDLFRGAYNKLFETALRNLRRELRLEVR